jgi:hypothetical protein
MGNDLPYTCICRRITAIAWYHKNLLADLQRRVKKAVEELAGHEYADAMMSGDNLPAARKTETLRSRG